MAETGARRDAASRAVPIAALLVSLVALGAPVATTVLVPDLGTRDYGFLVWLAALVPTFLLTYYRGLGGAAVAVVAGFVALAVSQLLLSLLDVGAPDWNWLRLVAVNFLVISIGMATLGELLHRDRRRAEILALVDQLTQLPNRRQAELALVREFAAAMRGRRLGVILYDIDHFKKFNDTHGHAVGDDVLREFAKVLDQFTRKQNISARFGGEEFISLVTDVPLEGMLIFANRVREAIRDREMPWGPVTVSGGLAVFREGMGSYEVLVAAADRALYAAKDAGRDRIMVAEDVARVSERVSAPKVAAPDRPKRVLVVHDEPAERAVLVRTLVSHGYEAKETGSPEEAARLLHEAPESVDVLVTSLVMPRISGFTLMDKLSDDAPDLRVVYISEPMRERVSWGGVPGAVHKFVAKPVKPEDLLATVQEAIDEEIEDIPGLE